MRRKLLYVAFAVVALAAVVVWQGPWTWGEQQPKAEEGPKPPAAALPITQVVLFNSGVGYFQREGTVEGDAHVNLSFPAGEMNDLLKSMVLQDRGGGKVSTVSYDSHDPIAKTLHSFALDLNNNPTYGQILNQARGEKVEIDYHRKTIAKGLEETKVTGVIVGLEVQQ